MPKVGRQIPVPTKRAVRQRCGFGCVICGKPIVQYDHIEEFSKVQEHKESNLTTLCPEHHDDKTHGRLPLEVLRRANAAPFNLKSGRSAAYSLHYGMTPITVDFGSVRFKTHIGDRCTPLKVDGVEVVSWRFEDGVYLLTVRWFDTDGNLVLEIDDNELVLNTKQWDVEFVSNRLTIRSGLGQLKLVVVFDPPRLIKFERAAFVVNGHRIDIAQGELHVDDSSIANLTISAPVGITVGGVAATSKGLIHVS